MTAGRGIVHAEMPRQNADGASNVGLQLWVDLPARLKACEPRYRDLRAAEIPVAQAAGVEVKVIAGRSLGVESAKDLAYTPVWMLDVGLQKGASLTQEVPRGWTVFAYVLEGEGVFGKEKKTVRKWHIVVFEDEGEQVEVTCSGDGEETLRFGKCRDSEPLRGYVRESMTA